MILYGFQDFQEICDHTILPYSKLPCPAPRCRLAQMLPSSYRQAKPPVYMYTTPESSWHQGPWKQHVTSDLPSVQDQAWIKDNLSPEEDQSIWSKHRQGSNPVVKLVLENYPFSWIKDYLTWPPASTLEAIRINTVCNNPTSVQIIISIKSQSSRGVCVHWIIDVGWLTSEESNETTDVCMCVCAVDAIWKRTSSLEHLRRCSSQKEYIMS